MNIQDFWNAVLQQDAERLCSFFADLAYINWHCTNERFTENFDMTRRFMYEKNRQSGDRLSAQRWNFQWLFLR